MVGPSNEWFGYLPRSPTQSFPLSKPPLLFEGVPGVGGRRGNGGPTEALLYNGGGSIQIRSLRGTVPPAGLPEMGRPDMRYGGRALDRIQHRERRGDKNHGPYSYAQFDKVGVGGP